MKIEEHEKTILKCAYKEDRNCTEAEKKARNIEAEICKKSFRRFLRYIKIVDAPVPGKTGGGIIPIELWPHLNEVIDTFLNETLIVVLKARQIGLSTIIAAYILWYALFFMGANILLFSKGQPEAKELLAKSRRMYEQLPSFLKLKLDPDSTEEIGFPTMNSSIKAFPSTASAGISYTASIVVADEHSEHPYAEENYLSSKPTRDAGGQFISVFTANKLHPDNLATAIYRDALEKKNSFKPLFFPWWVRPGRNKEWLDQTIRDIPDKELAGLTKELYREQNYPASIDEALRSSSAISVFEGQVLDEMVGDTCNPIKVVKDGIDPKIVKIYRDFHVGEFYIAATDASHGIGKDFGVTTIMNVKNGQIVADIMSNLLPPEELSMHSIRMLDIYNNPLWFPEDNEWGRSVINTAQTLGYKRLGKRKGDQIGWHTDDKSRFDLWGGLIPAINNHQITIYNVEGLRQFYDIIRNSSKNGKIEATAGRHDDYPMAVGICWAKKDAVQTTPWLFKPITTLHFR